MEWTTTGTERLIDSPHFRVRRDEVLLPDGGRIDDYYVWESPDIATVVPYTPEGRFVLVRQWRHAAGRAMLQFPAGQVDPGETARQAAERELVEETGYRATDYTHLGDINAFPTKATGWHHLYLAEGARYDRPPVDDPTERSEILLVSADELRDLLLDNEIQVACAVSAGLLALRRLGLLGG